MTKTLSAILLSLSFLLIQPVSSSYAADPKIIQQIIHYESRGNPKARGKAGEYGLMQIKCQTARGVGFKGKCSRLLIPEVNIKYGTLYYKLALKRARGNVCHALTLYNRGVGAKPRNSQYCQNVLRVKLK